MKTFTAKPSNIEHKWFLINAENAVLGRLSVIAANYLRGKHKPIFTTHMDCGDNIIIINANKIALTGNKLSQKKFYWHTGFPGGIKNQTMNEILSGKRPESIILNSIKRMISKGPLRNRVLKKLHIYKNT